jgi:nucleoid-associated protein YgaU
MADEKKKSIFDKAVDALTNRDEKAEAAEKAAKLQAEKIKAEADRATAAAAKARGEAAAKAKADAAKLAEEKAKVEAAQKERQEKLAQVQKEQADRLAAKKAEMEQKRLEEEAKAAIVKHVWTNEDTYASLAFKHYGSIKEPYWRLIYNHNKHIIGDHPNHIKTGTEIEIPPLPEELKKK